MKTTELSKDVARRLAKLDALEAGGVDNWEWYGESLKEYDATIGKEETAESIINEICSILGDGAYEPSERGAGFAFDKSCLDKAAKYLVEQVKEFEDEH